VAGPLGSGRDAEILAAGEGLVLRRPRRPRSLDAEADLMRYLESKGYPVPHVHEVRPEGIVMERIDGPSMLDDMGRHPWRLRSHARALADLHGRLHTIEPPPALRPAFGEPAPGDTVLHGDLHPDNVLLGPRGPVVIDWTNARRGPAGFDVALVWLLLACAEIHELPPVPRLMIAMLRRRFVAAFLSAGGRELAAPHLIRAAEARLTDPNMSAAEKEAMLRLARGVS
jgi:aminoglycoside phosphotransferase (APT) family kinase protein